MPGAAFTLPRRLMRSNETVQAALGSRKSEDFYVQREDRDRLIQTLHRDSSARDREIQLQDTQGNKFWILMSSQRISYQGESGSIVPLGWWVLESACAQLRRWNATGAAPLTMAVNISPRQFSNGNFIADLQSILYRTAIAPQQLHLEITGDVTMRGHATTEAILAALGTLEVGIAIVRAIIAMAHGLKLKVIAEGVENQSQSDLLLVLGCDMAQGYFFSVAITAVALRAFRDRKA